MPEPESHWLERHLGIGRVLQPFQSSSVPTQPFQQSLRVEKPIENKT
jgi:hypothetical protein